ncbi:MAG: beta-galactosidase [Clostridiales bacterium]|nr:beta-galactosidase [Clostridiales bacterium]
MPCSLNLSNIHTSDVYPLGDDFTGVSAGGEVISFNNAYMEKNGRPFFAVSGEFHYSRMDDARWEDELIKIRMGGVNVVSTYVFWNHHEEKEGCFDFTGQRDLRRFITLCAKHGLYVILRVGPFAHGEARNGGLPDWLYGKPFEVRSTSEAFLGLVRRLYSRISEQVQGLLWKDGGPVIGIQLDNEYMHSSAPWEMTTGISNEWVSPGTDGEAYLLALRQIALECGLIPAFFTGTAWGGAAYSNKILPLWGGYAYRPWLFYSHQGEHPATEEYVYEDYHRNGAVWADDFAPAYAPETRPYACCEMGAGMMCCYSYRFVYPCRSVDALANIKLGSGCNFIGYYMFHGGTNPIGRLGTYMNESQVSKISYDYQAALGEYGQIRESYSRLKVLHYFLQSFGDRLAPMQTVLPDGASAIDPRDTQTLRFAVRTDGESGFLFVNNFQDHLVLPDRVEEEVVLKTRKETCRFAFGIASEENAVLPFHFDMDGILLRQAHAQPVLRTVIGGRVLYVFMVPDGMDGAFCFEETAQVTGGKPFFTVRKGQVQVDVLVLTRAQTDQLFLLRDGSLVLSQAALLEDEHGTLRLESTEARNTLFCFPPERLRGTALRLPDEGPFGVYCAETCAKQISVRWEPCAPFRWTLQLPEDTLDGLKDARLQIDYQGDIGMLFLNDRMISDNFCNGATWEIGLLEQKGRLPGTMVLKITPLRKDAKVNVESAMAARKEEVRTTVGELLQVRVQPVYEIKL